MDSGAFPANRAGGMRRLTVDGLERHYLLTYPPDFDLRRPTGAILAFHGGGGSPLAFRQATGLDRAATARGFVVVYPQGYKSSWNVGDRRGPAFEERIDDIGFAKALLDDLDALFPVDAARLFAMGFSNGGSLVYRLACEMPERLAAIAVVGGSLPSNPRHPGRPIPLLHIHGLIDRMSPFSGIQERGPASDITQRGIPETIGIWIGYNGLSALPSAASFGADIGILEYRRAGADADVVVCLLAEVGHQWPGGQRIQGFGPGAGHWSGVDAIVDFFVAHPRAPWRARIGRERLGQRDSTL